MTLGPVMLDLTGLELTGEEVDLLRHPAVGGVILFSRNYQSIEQLQALCLAIHQLRQPPLLIAVDQEGGRVQRFREGFTRLPPAAWFGQMHQRHAASARHAAERIGWLMAMELRLVGVDFSFAPVLDLDRGLNSVIGDRAFAAKPGAVADLARAWMAGVHAAGMAAVGKHFPGHGGVAVDSHESLPVDEREFEDIWNQDLAPFHRLIDTGLEAVMPAHLVYPRVDPRLAGFSKTWLQQVLRQRLGFQGAIFSDDLSMGATLGEGGYPERAHLALGAGCDMVLVCNNRAGAVEVVQSLQDYQDPVAHTRTLRMHGRHQVTPDQLLRHPYRLEGLRILSRFDSPTPLELDFS